MIRGAALGLGLAIVAVAHAVPAAAETEQHILGAWCGYGNNRVPITYDFYHDYFTVTWHDNNEQKTFRITRFEDFPRKVKVHWLNGNNLTWTEFGEFTPDGREMLQLPNEAGPLRVFQRC